MFQSYPVSGSFSRSAVNINAGAVTGFSSVITVIIVALVAFVFTLALAPELEMGILFGMLLSLVLLLFRIMKPRVAFPPLNAHQMPPEAVVAGAIDDGRIVRMRFEGSLVFANVAFFEEQLHKLLASTPQLKVLVIDAVAINEVDASGDQMLHDYFIRLTESGIDVLFTRVRKPILAMFERSHMHDDVGKEYFHRNPVDAFKHAWDLIVAHDEAEQKEENDSEKNPTE